MEGFQQILHLSPTHSILGIIIPKYFLNNFSWLHTGAAKTDIFILMKISFPSYFIKLWLIASALELRKYFLLPSKRHIGFNARIAPGVFLCNLNIKILLLRTVSDQQLADIFISSHEYENFSVYSPAPQLLKTKKKH